MKKQFFYFSLVCALLLLGCKEKKNTIHASTEGISESVYASGIIKSLNQYTLYPTVSGIIDSVYVQEGDTVKKGSSILFISNETSRLNKENAMLAAGFADYNANAGKLDELKISTDLAKNKMLNDSLMYFRQKNLWNQQIGSKAELEQRELAYQNSKTAYQTSMLRFEDGKKQLSFLSEQSKKNLSISGKTESDYTIKSEIAGIVYSVPRKKGELVGIQSALAVIGDANVFYVEMQVDEYDILKVKLGQQVFVSMDAYKGQSFEAKVTKIDPLMNERTKSFTVEAQFVKRPDRLFPNISLEASIVLQTKEKALTIPRNYITADSCVIKANGDKVKVVTGLKDYSKVEILSGITAEDELSEPAK